MSRPQALQGLVGKLCLLPLKDLVVGKRRLLSCESTKLNFKPSFIFPCSTWLIFEQEFLHPGAISDISVAHAAARWAGGWLIWANTLYFNKDRHEPS